MGTEDPIDLLFGGMEKLGPGGDVHTLNVLPLLPECEFKVTVDAGCGTGRQTLVLAAELGSVVHAVDLHQPFLDDLTVRADTAGLGNLVKTYRMDMADIPTAFPHIDMLWSEGAAYNLGFANALETWAAAINAGGFAVISELSWLSDDPPAAAKEFFRSGYPDMLTVPKNIETCERAGYRVLSTYTLPPDAWVEGYYDELEPRARELATHPDPSVRELAAETLEEIAIFNSSAGSYGYVFYLLRRP